MTEERARRYDAEGRLESFASARDDADGANAVGEAAARCLGARRATIVVCEGTGRRLAEDAFAELDARGLVAGACGGPHVVSAEEWRTALLSPKERVDAKKAKHAARLVARQLAGGLEAWPEDLTTDDAEAACLGAWACSELKWRDEAVAARFGNGDLRMVAKRPIVEVS